MILIDSSVILCLGEFLRREYEAALARYVNAEDVDNVGHGGIKWTDEGMFAIEHAGLWTLRTFCDTDLCAHAQRLVRLAEAVGGYLRLRRNELFLLRMAALLHDIGKAAVPASILDNPGALSPEERACMQQHPQLGQRILCLAGSDFAQFAPLVVAHHECWDGSGYPSGLRGEQIPLLARILTVVDAYDAMVSRRVYGNPQPIVEAYQELVRCAGQQFDPQMVDAFLSVFGGQPAQRPVIADISLLAPHPVDYAKSLSR